MIGEGSTPGAMAPRGSLGSQVSFGSSCRLRGQRGIPRSINGAWLSPSADNWPFVPVHAALTPDGRVLSFGSSADGQSTGFFSYDVWDPEEGLSGGHTTLQNMTLTDIFCSYAVILPTNGSMLIAGGDNWTGTEVTNTGNDDSNIFTPSDNLLTRGNEMKRPRWYASATPLMNGEIYIQGGKNGEDVAEVRDVFGQFRTLTGVQTGDLDWWYPRNFLAPDGRIFGLEDKGLMYYVSTEGQGTLTVAGQLDHDGRRSTVDVRHVSAWQDPHCRRQVQESLDHRHQWIPTNVVATKPLLARRTDASSTVLPDGKVLVTGGSGIHEQLRTSPIT